MTHEIHQLFKTAALWQSEGVQAVLATVVDLDGSSYRKPGVRMLIGSNGKQVGAVSGGCVEKEIVVQALEVFSTGKTKVITYDGRLRLGCEGVLYVLLEVLEPVNSWVDQWEHCLEHREEVEIHSYYRKTFGPCADGGSTLRIGQKVLPLSSRAETQGELMKFQQSLDPLLQLIIFGAEHDAVALCKAAAGVGWKVTIVAPPDEQKSIEYFEGAQELVTPLYDNLSAINIDDQTAVVMMTHSINKDVQYLLALQESRPAYLGLLGPHKRKGLLMDKLIDFNPEISLEFIDLMVGPAGIDIGAESAQEIAISIVAEILTMTRGKRPIHLKDKKGKIHE